MRRTALSLVVLLMAGLVAPAGRGLRAQDQPEKKDEKKKAEVSIDYAEPSEEKKDEEEAVPYAPPIEELFQNPVVQANFAQTAEELNRSVDSLMESVFYSVLTNEQNVYVTPNLWFNATLQRKVFTAPSGAYVVVDRFTLGPRYAKTLWQIQNIPVNLGIDGSVEVLQIYLRTDGMRLAEQEQLSPLRRFVNNWFGLVPFLAMILPPSFNQNYLYDPVKQLETPFTFPLDPESVEGMQIGSIRSYALSGGIALAPDLGGLIDQATQQTLQRIGGITATSPYAIFKRGEHRITVLRRSEHVAWVGVSDMNRTGHMVTPLVGNTYFVLTGALAANILKYTWMWKGVPALMYPINVDVEQANADLFDQLYEFDLRNPLAREAYHDAVRGNFTTSHDRYLDAKEKGVDTGVTFAFARQQNRLETVETNGPNIAVLKKERRRRHDEAELEITDREGKFYVLQSQLDVADKRWDVLTGDKETRSQQALEMRVKRVIDKEDPENAKGYRYVFEEGADPYRLTMALNIQDKITDTVAYHDYIRDLRAFTGMPLREVPEFPKYDAAAEAVWRRKSYFTEPPDQVNQIHVTPTFLGRFGAQASLTFTTRELEHIVAAGEDEIWAAYADAFGYDGELWAKAAYRDGLAFQTKWFAAFFAYPLRLFNVRFAAADAVVEATNGVKAIMALKSRKTPLEKLDGFFELLSSEHPRELARAMLTLADLGEIPRRVSFSVDSKAVNKDAKDAYQHLNGKTFRAGPRFPEPTRYDRAKAKLEAFYLNQPHEAEHKPSITRIQVTTRQIPEAVRQLTEPQDVGPASSVRGTERDVFVTFTAKDVLPLAPIKVYVKVGEAGRLKLGKLDLSEKVMELSPLEKEPGPGNTHAYEFYLTGPMSPLDSYMLQQAVESGDEFEVVMAVSREGEVWSQERTFSFRYQDGELFPAGESGSEPPKEHAKEPAGESK